jgi:DNA-binding transcriptional LysR family regulator
MATQSLPTHIKTRQLVLLAHLDRERSVLRAASAAGLSQPAASKLLRELEETLGVPLFERHARGVEPNAFGEILMRHAHSVMSELGRAQDEVEALKRGESYRVAIGSVLSPGTDLLPTAVALLERRHPRMVIGIELDTSQTMVAKLLEGRLDIVIGRVLDSENAAGLAFEALADEPHSLVARAGHPLSKRRRKALRVEDLVDFTWIFPPPGSIVRGRVNAMFLQRGLPLPSRIIETLPVSMVTHLLRRSDALVALPEEVVRPYCEAGMLQLLPIDLNVRMDAFGLITRRGHALSRHAEDALQALREAAQSVYGAARRP